MNYNNEFYNEVNLMIEESQGKIDVERSRESAGFSISLFGLIVSTKSKTILETGVRSGGTTIPLLMGAFCNKGTVFSVDNDEKALISFKVKCPTFLKHNSKLIHSDSITYLESCVKNRMKFDFMFIDDWHEYYHVKRQLELIDLLTTNNSIITMHDAMARNTQPYYNFLEGSAPNSEFGNGSVARAILELDKTKFEYCTIPVYHGLTIIRKL